VLWHAYGDGGEGRGHDVLSGGGADQTSRDWGWLTMVVTARLQVVTAPAVLARNSWIGAGHGRAAISGGTRNGGGAQVSVGSADVGRGWQ
jgi:hypothetical protein